MSSDLGFAVCFARQAGGQMVDMRKGVGVRRKLDRTAVSDADERINREFIQAIRTRSGGCDAVRGEELSDQRPARRVWVIDPIDGTGEYIDPSIPDEYRTSCVGIALLESGRLVLSVVFNPFRRELFTVQRGGPTLLNGRPIRCSAQQAQRGVAYDYAYWDGARFHLPRLERVFGSPLGVYSAIYQACMVAAGRSAFAAFAGDTIHDIAPATLVAVGGGARVTDFAGLPLNWLDLSRGVLYANPASQATALRVLRSL